MIAVAGALTPERSFRHQDFRGDCVCSKEPEPVLFENRRDALEQVIVTADENDIAAAFPARKPAERAELAERRPVVWIGLEPFCIRPTVNGEKHHATPALAHRVGDGKRQASAAADDRQRTAVCRMAHRRLAHASSPRAARRMAMVSGREPERIKAITLATRGSAPLCAATLSSRSRNVPLPKNMAS